MVYTKKAFTIVELLIVIVVIAILAAISIVAYNGIQSRARVSALHSELSQAFKQLELEKINDSNGHYPVALPSSINNSDGTYAYFRNTATSYCLTKTSDSTSAFLTSESARAAAGSCIGMNSWWPLNNSSNDMSGNGYHGNITGATAASGQSSGGAYSFDGNDYISLPNAGVVGGSGAYSVSAWFKSSGLAAKGIVGWGNYGSTNQTTAMRMDATYGLRLYWFGNDLVINDTSVGDNQWHLVVDTYDGTTQRGYVDGVQRATRNVSGRNSQTINGRIGSTNNGEYFVGSIDDVRIYSRALTANEIASMYSGGAF